MNDDFIEAILLWLPGADQDAVRNWMREHNLQALTMQAGLLINGTGEDFQKAFSVDLTGAARPFSLPLPELLTRHVASITIPPPRKIHKSN